MTGSATPQLQPCRAGMRRVVLLAAAVLAASCAPGSAVPGGRAQPWPPSPPVVEVTMRDFAFDIATPVPAGRVVFRVRNAGSVDHRVTLVPLPEDLPPIEEQIQGDERRGVQPVGAVNPRRPGTDGVFAVDLEPGRRYALLCFQETDDGTVHARKGMNAEFRAGGPGADPPAHDPPR